MVTPVGAERSRNAALRWSARLRWHAGSGRKNVASLAAFDVDAAADPSLDVQGGTWYTIRVASRTAQASGGYILNVSHTCGAVCAADIAPQPDGDGLVNVSDLLMVINTWGAAGSADIAPPDGDGVVNVADLLMIVNNWGSCL